MRRLALIPAAVLVAVLAWAPPGDAHAPSGAIFTTVEDGSEVNFNHYADKLDVYLDGGPGPGAPQHAAGLDDGTYVFQVTDPSGKVLLSQDIARCRRVTVLNGVLDALVTDGCAVPHDTGLDVDHGALTVQLMPYADTPNPGGVYKAWITTVEDFLAGCAALGVNNGLDVVDCGGKTRSNAHGFVPAHSKTDNFKVKHDVIREIDTRFFPDRNGNGDKDADEDWIDGLGITWKDPVGGSNKKWSYWAPDKMIFHEAHVEAIEDGTHTITVADQPGCTVGRIHLDGQHLEGKGGRDIPVTVRQANKSQTIFIDVACV